MQVLERKIVKVGTQQSGYAEAADVVHAEARWCLEQERRGETPSAVDALLKVERILRDWASK